MEGCNTKNPYLSTTFICHLNILQWTKSVFGWCCFLMRRKKQEFGLNRPKYPACSCSAAPSGQKHTQGQGFYLISILHSFIDPGKVPNISNEFGTELWKLEFLQCAAETALWGGMGIAWGIRYSEPVFLLLTVVFNTNNYAIFLRMACAFIHNTTFALVGK